MRAAMLSLDLLLLVLPAGAQEPAQPRFTIDTATSQRPGCKLIAMSVLNMLEADDLGERRKLTGLIEVRQEGRKLPALPARDFLTLTNGDVLPLDAASAAKFTGTRLQVWPAASLGAGAGKDLKLFAPQAVLLFWSLPDGIDEPEPFFARLQKDERKRDVAYLKNGDKLEGTLAELSGPKGCILTQDGADVSIPWTKLAGIAFNSDRQARLKTKQPYTRAALAGGARVNFIELSLSEKTRRWVGKTQFGAVLELDEANLLALDVRQDRAVDLSELTPSRYEHRPFLDVHWPLGKDAAATGRPLRLVGDTFEKGLGMHAASSVAYNLAGKFNRFDAVVGIDEPSHKGRAKIAIDLDGKRIDLNDGKEITAKTAPVHVRLDVTNVRTLTLIVELGSLGDIQANVSWVKARLIKKE